ncbi:MAG: DUF2628 domain-containing protein [Granulosicoccus sp.]
MFDEELYQQAADELNSDRRKAHIWARACALSKDDHDEARYLYTNLRVEELMAEREAGMRTGIESHSTDHDSTLSLDSSDFDLSASVQTSDLSGSFSADDTLSFPQTESVHGGHSGQAESDDLMRELSEISLSNEASQASQQRVEFEQQFDAHATGKGKEYYDQNPNQLLDRDATGSFSALENNNEELNMLLDGVDSASEDSDEGALTADFTDSTITESILVDDELEWLNDSESDKTSLQIIAPVHPDHEETDRFTQELLRQADEMPGQHSDVVATDDVDEDVTWEPSPRANEVAVGTAAAIGAARYGKQADVSPARFSENDKHSGFPVDLTDGKSGTEFSVYKRGGSVQAVKQGVSWSALFFTFPYLVYRHLFGTAIVYAITTALVLAGLIFFGLNWLDAGDAATNQTKAFAAGFALLAFIGLLYLPFRHGNAWRSEKLESRGYELVAHVNAVSSGRAIARARRASALD